MSDKTAKKTLRFGLPKGSLQESTFALMAKAGWKISSSSRSYIPRTDDAELELRLIRAQEISRYVEHGFLDAIVPRKEMKQYLSQTLSWMTN